MSKRFLVTVVRVTIESLDIEVEADDETRAEAKAVSLAPEGEEGWNQKDVEYQVDDVEELEE